MTTINTKQAQQAATLRATHKRTVDDIRNNPQLTDAGKQQQMLEANARNQSTMKDLRTAHNAGLEARREALVSKLFGTASNMTGAALISYRDAADRAAKLTKPDDALSTLRRALAAGDDEVAAAIARHAADLTDGVSAQAWWNVFSTWQDARRKTLPDVDDVVSELGAIDSDLGGRDLFTFALNTPSEVRGVTPGMAAGLADAPKMKPFTVDSSNSMFR